MLTAETPNVSCLPLNIFEISTLKMTIGERPLFTRLRRTTSMVELLVEKGASIDAMDEYKMTPLHLAGQSGHASTVELEYCLRKVLRLKLPINTRSPHCILLYGMDMQVRRNYCLGKVPQFEI